MTTKAWPFGHYPPGGIEQLGPNVTAYYADAMPLSNSAIVRGTEFSLVFDANILRFARSLRAAAYAEGPPVAFLVLSHVHDDHSLGAMHFAPPARVLARAYTRERLVGWAERGIDPAEYADLYEGAEGDARSIRVVVPDAVIEEDREVDLGGGVVVHLQPFDGAAHTQGDLWAYVEPDGVVLCGDLWFEGCEPYLESGSIRGAIAAIERLADAAATICLPGHGRAARLGSAREDPVVRYCEWLLEETATGLGRGLRGGELQAAVRVAREADASVRFGLEIPGFLEANVERAERELTES